MQQLFAEIKDYKNKGYESMMERIGRWLNNDDEYVKVWLSPNFIEQDSELSLIKENIVFGLVADIRTEIFADYAVPIGTILLIEFLLDVLRHEILDFEVINCVFGLG